MCRQPNKTHFSRPRACPDKVLDKRGERNPKCSNYIYRSAQLTVQHENAAIQSDAVNYCTTTTEVHTEF